MIEINKRHNIFRGLDFSEPHQESSLDILLSYKDDFKLITNGELLLEINSIPENLNNQFLIHHRVSVFCPKLGNYRRVIFEIIESKIKSKFPVDIYCYIDNKLDKQVEKENFISVITEIFEREDVKNDIEDLFYKSKSINK